MNLTDSAIQDNRHQHRFELETDGKISFVVYQAIDEDTLALVHTEVDPELSGKGIGTRLVEGVLNYVEHHNLKIVPLCPFVAAYLKRRPDWNRVVSSEYSVDDF